MYKKWQALVNLILKKISKIGATRCQMLRLKCTKIDFRWGSAPDPAGGAYSAPPDPLAVFKGPTSKEKEGEGEERREREGKGREGRGRTTLHTPCCKFLATPLTSCRHRISVGGGSRAQMFAAYKDFYERFLYFTKKTFLKFYFSNVLFYFFL